MGSSNPCPKNLPLKTDLFIYIPPTNVLSVRKRVLCWTDEINVRNEMRKLGMNRYEKEWNNERTEM